MQHFQDFEDPNYIGARVIIRTNENEPCRVGTLVGWEHGQGRDYPLVQQDDGTSVMVMGALLPYHEGLETLLNSLPPKEGWTLVANIILLCKRRDHSHP